ncbi:MAG: DUF423 domain-containing protein [Defluviicoccus sp.]|nr:MAG: DUF423 domain-containing protein [Defluviicoccus sp.]
MPIATRIWLFVGALNGLLSVAAGAYGRHGALDPAGREMFAIASHYQMAHGLALLAVAWLASRSAEAGGWLTAENIAGRPSPSASHCSVARFTGSGSRGWCRSPGRRPRAAC